MKKRVSKEEVGKIMAEVADKIRRELDYDFRVAYSQMCMAENDLVDALHENQYDLYRDYAEKRNAFFRIAEELYERKF